MNWDVSSVIRSVKSKFQLLVLIVILGFISFITWLKISSQKDDCSAWIVDNENLLKTQSRLVLQNANLMKETDDLYFKLSKTREIAHLIKTDTIIKIVTVTNTLENYENLKVFNNGDTVVNKADTIKQVSVKWNSKKGNKEVLLNQIDSLSE